LIEKLSKFVHLMLLRQIAPQAQFGAATSNAQIFKKIPHRVVVRDFFS
jgi:hypothetical protein